MATNFPGPYEVRIFYTVNLTPGGSFTHEQRFNVDASPAPNPGDLFSTIVVNSGGGSFDDLQSVVDRWIVLAKVLYNSGTATFDYAELWKYTPGTFLSSFVSSYTIGVAGTSGSSNQIASQAMWVFRTAEGGILKLNLLESVGLPTGLPRTYASMSAPEQAIANFVTDPAYPSAGQGQYFLGRDTSYPFSVVALYPGQNEAVFKRRYRP